MNKLAIIRKDSPAAWKSCQTILNNLVASYSLLENCELKSFSMPQNPNNYSLAKIADEIFSFAPTQVCFTDYHPHPAPLISLLAHKSWTRKPRLLIHVYGDFVINSPGWIQIAEELQKFSVRWICASEKQAGLLKKFVEPPTASIGVLPFPVNAAEFFYSKELRDSWRLQNKISEKEFCWLYAGRLSHQKNIDSLIESFRQYQKNFSPNSRLLVAGPIDDLGTPYLGKSYPTGLMSYHYAQILNKAPNLSYLGQLESAELNAVGNACDAFVSLSVHNDEDYGMSPAEGLMTGLPAVLSAWGGYSGFINYFPQFTKSVPVTLESKKLSIDPRLAAKTMFALESETAAQDRQKNAESVRNRLGLAVCAKNLQGLIDEKPLGNFSGWTKLFQQVASTVKIHPAAPFKRGQEYSQLYRQVYGEYGN